MSECQRSTDTAPVAPVHHHLAPPTNLWLQPRPPSCTRCGPAPWAGRPAEWAAAALVGEAAAAFGRRWRWRQLAQQPGGAPHAGTRLPAHACGLPCLRRLAQQRGALGRLGARHLLGQLLVAAGTVQREAGEPGLADELRGGETERRNARTRWLPPPTSHVARSGRRPRRLNSLSLSHASLQGDVI